MTKQPGMRSPVLRRAYVAASMLLVATSVAACRKVDSGDTTVVVIGEPPKMVDPAAGPLTEPQSVLLSSVAQGLVRFDASGQIVPGLAERWNVTDDGLSYIFRLKAANWPNGGKITAQQVARLLRRQLATRSRNAIKDTLGAIEEIVPMTDRVIEIRLRAPRPHLLQLLAQPEFSIVRENLGTGPFQPAKDSGPNDFHLIRSVTNLDEEVVEQEHARLSGLPAAAAVTSFIKGDTALVLGGTFADLAYARVKQIPKGSLQFDPAMGLFGLVPARADGPFADPEIRRMLDQAIDRQAMIDALDVPGLLPRATLLEPGLDGTPDPTPPQWSAVAIDQRRGDLAAKATRMFGSLEKPTIRVALPDSPGSEVILTRLASDWGALGLTVEAAKPGQQADFRLIDAVAPSTSPAWYLRTFRCGTVAICDPQADEFLDGARAATIVAQRNGLLAQAAQRMEEQQLFIALAAPIRWSLVSTRVQSFATNRFARHTLTSLRQKLDRERSD